MSIPPGFEALTGQWRGIKKLWLSPAEPMHESETTMTVAVTIQGRFLILHYGWEYGDMPQEGFLLMGYEKQSQKVEATWIDSWHMQDKIMTCRGEVLEGGDVVVRGSYAAPTGPDWGWSIKLKLVGDSQWQLQMENITPGGESHLAVQVDYFREA